MTELLVFIHPRGQLTKVKLLVVVLDLLVIVLQRGDFLVLSAL
jgi:hypothetical protein